jgi:beta-N-acetylhexosaminidase
VSALRQGCRALLIAGLAACVVAGCGGTSLGRVAAGPPGELALGMPVQDAVAQLFAVGFAGTGPQAPMVARLRTRAWGMVVLEQRNVVAPVQARTLARSLRTAARRGGRPAPLIAAAHPESYPGVQILPPYQQVSAADVGGQARRAAQVLRADSVRAAFAPRADVGYAGGPAEQTAYSSDPAAVAMLSAAAAAAWRAAGVMPIAGHFPGEGSASRDPAEGAATVGLSLQDLRRDVAPFAGAARAGAPGIQVSDSLYAAFDGVTPAALLPEAYRLLRRTGFDGVAMSGDLVAATAATGSSVAQAAVDALRAGADLLYVPGDAANQEDAYRAVLDAVKRGRISRQRLAEALLRVSALKRQALQAR